VEHKDPAPSQELQLVVNPALAMYGPWLRQAFERGFNGEALSEYLSEGEYDDNTIFLVQAGNHRTRTYSRVPRQATEDFVATVLPALEVMVGALNRDDHKLFTQALQSFLIIPQFALSKTSGEKPSSQDIIEQLHKFRAGPKRKERVHQPHAPRAGPAQDLPPHVERAINQVKHFAGEGRYSKASQRLEQAVEGRRGALEPTEEVIAQLKKLHPPASAPPNEPPEFAPKHLPIVMAKLQKAGARIANGSAADLFGWTGELMHQLLRDPRTRACLAKVVEAIRDGAIPEQAREWLLASWLIPLDKGEGKVRPIAGGTILVKLAASYLMEAATAQAKVLLSGSGTQCGLFMKGGATAAAHFTQLCLDRDPSHIAIKIDFANAFNAIPRSFLLDQLYSYPELTSFFRLAHWAYHRPSHLLLRGAQGEIAAVLQSAEGVRQGCVLGSLAYGVATLAMLTKLKEMSRDIETLAYLDDVSIAGKQEQTLQAYEQLCEEGGKIGIEVQKEKCEVLLPAGELSDEWRQAIQRHGLRTRRGALPLLGTVVGNNLAEMEQVVKEKVEKWENALALLAREEVPAQLALLVARWSMVAKPNMLARSLPPSITTRSLAQFDDAVIRVIEERLQLTFTDLPKELLKLPLRHGGVGFCPSAITAPHAFVAGVAASQAALLRQSNLARHNISSVSEGLLLKELQSCLDRYTSSPLDWPEKEHLTNAAGFVQHFTDPKKSHKLQSRLMATLRTNDVEQLKAKGGLETKARLESRANKGSALVWKAFPLTAEFQLTDEETRFTVAYATGLTLAHMPQRCSCRQLLTLEHSVHCGPTKLVRHNMIQSRFVAFAREHAVALQQNPRSSFEEAKELREPDVVFYPGITAPIETDVTVINPCAPSRIKRCGAHRWASTEAKAKKNRKYLKAARAKGNTFKPLVFETHGKIAEEVKDLLHVFAARTPGVRGLAVHDMQVDLALTLAKGNAECARSTIARAQRHRDLSRGAQPL
jgi:hypothetical protein